MDEKGFPYESHDTEGNGTQDARAAHGTPSVGRREFVAGGALLGLLALAGCSGSSSSSSMGSDSGGSSSGSSSASELRCGMEAANAPYNWQTDTESDYTIPIDGISGAYADGYDVQIAKLIGQELDREPIAVKVAWSGLIEAVTQGSIDLIVAGMTPTDERRESIDFTDPYITDTFGLMVRSDSEYAGATSLADFAGASVMGQKDTLLDQVIDEIPDVNHLTPADSIPSCITALKNGTCDAIVYNVLSKEGYLKANPDLVAIEFADGEGFAEDEPCAIGLAKGQDDLLERLNKVIDGLSDDERMDMWNAAVDRQPA